MLGALSPAYGQAPATQVYSGGHHTCVVTPAGGVHCWGRNAQGQLGNGANADSSVPVPVFGLSSGIVRLAAGGDHTCALTTAGGVKCWGWNVYGQLGVLGGNLNVPIDVPGLGQGVIAIEAGEYHTCALNAAGGVACWGNNNYGQVGDGTYSHRFAPTGVLGLSSGVKAIASGDSHTCAILRTGSARCWGANEYYQLGSGTIAGNVNGGMSTPALVTAVAAPIESITTGRFHTCVVTSTGGASCWGRNDAGELGSGSTSNQPSLGAVQVVGLASGVAEIDAGFRHACAVLDDGSVRCWGTNDRGELGNGTSNLIGVATPASALGLASGVASVSAGWQHTCAVTLGGSVRCFGFNEDGRVGNGASLPGPDVLVPAVVAGFTASVAASDLAIGGEHACQVDASGAAWCWGSNSHGQLGNGSNGSSTLPVKVSGLANASALALGGYHSCALTTAGGVKCWGSNGDGQLGVAGGSRTTPVDVPGLASGVAAIAAGWAHTCVLTTAGAVRCWGANALGQLGDGTHTGRTTPAIVTGLASGVLSITTGYWHSCAVLNGTSAKCWGLNENGQLGNGTLAANGASGEITTPVDMVGLGSPVDRLSAGGYHTCAVVGSAAKCWGHGDDGQLGNGSDVDRLSATAIPDLASGVAGIASGATHTCAVMLDGRVKCWGANAAGQLGIGAPSARSLTPVDAAGFAVGGAARIRGGLEQTCATTAAGWPRCWGENAVGQVGDGTQADRASQAEVRVRAQSIAFVPPASIKVGVPAPLAATAQSGLAVGFSSWPTTSCTVAGSTLTARSAGLCGVRASQGGNADFFAAPSQLRIVVVEKGDQAIAFPALASKAWTDPPFTVIATATSGLAVVLSSSTPSICTASGSTVTVIAMGACGLVANQPGDANYNAAPQATASFAVGKGNQAISFAAPATRTLADPPFTPSATASSGLAVVFSSLTPAVCTVAGATVTLHAAGTCTLAADQPGNATYAAAAQVTQAFLVYATPASLPRLANIATRGRVLTGNDVMIGGFVIGGSGNKTVVVRARGPSLIPYGIANALANPMLQLFSGQAQIAINDNWQSAANAATLQALGFAPSDGLEAAIMVNLAPGAYTAIVSGVSGGTGVGIVEVFEVDHPEVPLSNIATRGQVLTGADVMIGGFVIQGDGPKTVVVRARGPSLIPFGITNALANPLLQLVAGQAVVATNDDWASAANAAQLQALGFAPGNLLESAILVTLSPGAYTAIVSGVGGGTGVGIVEVFAQ